MRKDHLVFGGTTMFFKDGSPSSNHGILLKHHPCIYRGTQNILFGTFYFIYLEISQVYKQIKGPWK
jgi:hypothetical protein